MSAVDDDSHVTTEAEARLRAQLEALVTTVPAPSPALAELLRDGVVPDLTPAPARRKRRWLVAIPLTVAVLGGTVGAASANVLPAPAQGVVSDTVGTLTPFHLPKAHKQHKPKPAPAQLAPRATPTHPDHPQLPPPARQHRPTDVPRGHATR